MDPLLGFGVFVGALLIVLSTGTPVAVAMGLLGILGVHLFLPEAALTQIANIAFTQSANFVLIVVPLFVLMGEALTTTGIGRDLFTAAQIWLRRLPGALAVGTVFACSIFAAVCGSSPVTAATIGAMSVPEMIRQGYDRRLALGVTAAGGTLGILIPPSIPMIVYGVITETSVGDLFIAGVLPGIGMAILLSGTVMLMVWRDPKIAPRVSTAIAERDRWSSLRSVVPVIILSILVLGSIYAGFATPTEAGAVGALGAIAIAGAVGALTVPAIGRMLGNTVRTTAMFILLIVAGLFTSFVLARLGVPQGMANILVELPVPPWAILAAINVVLVILGMFMDPMSILVIMVPVLFPGITALGYDPVWLGIVLTINIEIAAISPPVGFNLFVLKATIPNTEMSDIIRGSAVFMLPLVLGIGLLIAFPEIALVLVQMMK